MNFNDEVKWKSEFGWHTFDIVEYHPGRLGHHFRVFEHVNFIAAGKTRESAIELAKERVNSEDVINWQEDKHGQDV